MDSSSTSSLHESSSLNFFPSAVPESPSSCDDFQSSKPENSPPTSGTVGVKTEPKREMAVTLNIGPSREPVPLMRYEFHKSSIARKSKTSHDLIIKSKQIQTKFSNLILDVCSLLQDSPSSHIEKLQMWLSFQSCSKSVQSLQAFHRDSDALKVKTIPAFISSLRCYTSWYNYGLIADIARQFCANKGAALVTSYEADLKDYFQTLILHCPPLFPDHRKLSHDQSQNELLEMKVGGWDASTAILEDLALFKNTLCQLCDLDPRFLVIKEINTTSFKMSWAIPKAATAMLKEATKLNSDTLYHENNVQAIKIGDLKMDFQESKARNEVLDLQKKIRTRESFVGRSLLGYNGPNTRTQSQGDPNTQTQTQRDSWSNTHAQGQDANTRTGNPTAGASRIHRSFSQTPKDPRKGTPEKSRTSRDRKALSLVTAEDIFGPSSLLSEITKTLKVSNLLSCEPDITTAPSSKFVQQTESKYADDKDQSVGYDEVFLQDSCPAEHFQPTVASEKSVSFLWRVLGRARPNFHANIYVVSIQATSKTGKGGVEVRKGQQLKALYRESDQVFVQTLCSEQGFVPYSLCRLSRKHYGPQSKLIQLSYLRLYPQSPDGIDTLPVDQIPRIEMMASRTYVPSSHEELYAEIDQTFTILYCDTEWIYASNGKSSGLLPRLTCNLSHDSKKHFEQWDLKIQPFQSDFSMKYDNAKPQILNKSPVPVSSSVQRTGSKVGKIFTIIQNFIPTSPTSGTFTIRKGLRVRVVEEITNQVRVTTKTGTSFWIPQNHVRPARKNSAADKFVHTE